jgi:hypothetical protein
MADKKFQSVIVKETGPWQNAMEMRMLGKFGLDLFMIGYRLQCMHFIPTFFLETETHRPFGARKRPSGDQD